MNCYGSTTSEILNGVVVVIIILLFPEGEVFLEELNDGLGITEVVFFELVDLVEGLLERLVGDLASLLVVLHDLVLEHGEVKGETESDGVAGLESDAVGFVVGLEGIVLDLLEVVTLGVLSDVAVVVTDHLDEESLGLTIARFGKNLGVDNVNDTLAVSLEASLDGGLVPGEGVTELGVLGVLLDGGNSAASGSLGGDEVLESNREEVSLIGADISSLLLENFSKEINHILESLGLLSDSGKEYLFFNGA